MSALKHWMAAAKENEGAVPARGTGNFSSDEAKEIARLQKELRDTKDALEILKKSGQYPGKMTTALYRATYEYVTACGQELKKHRVSVSRILKLLGVSRSGYYAWKKRWSSASERRREQIKDRIFMGNHIIIMTLPR